MAVPFNLPANIGTKDYSQTIGTTAVQIWGSNNFPYTNLSFMRIYNCSATATLWVSRSGVAAANTAGSFPILPGNAEIWVYPGPIPINALSIISSAASTPVTIEVG